MFKIATSGRKIIAKHLIKLAPKLTKKLGKKFLRFSIRLAIKKLFQKIVRKSMIVAAKTAAKSAARLAAKQAAKMGVKLIFKTIGAALKSFAKLAAGPVGWALMVFDMFSMTLDIIDISGYEKMQTTQMFVLQRETIKKELNKYLNELAKENEAQGHGRNVNYPAIRGPLDKLSEKEFNF